MNFDALKSELADRGFTYLNDTRRGYFINRAIARLDTMFRWPYRYSTATGTMPITITDMGQVDFVVDSTGQYPLCEASRKDIINWYGDVSLTGTPIYWYRTPSAGTESSIVNAFPVSTSDQFEVRYWIKSTDLSSPTDEPLAPDRYHLLYVDLAVQLAYRDSDNHASAESLWVEINRQIGEMIEDLLPQHDVTTQRTTWSSEDN